jgi:23S rRNA pseudouridine1911/1915/1917 synthase
MVFPSDSAEHLDEPIGRHPVDRKKMSVTTRTPRSALTHWRVREAFAGACLLELDIRTGRDPSDPGALQTMGHPVIGDPVYGNRETKKGWLHVHPRWVGRSDRRPSDAARLAAIVLHPETGERMTMEAPMPAGHGRFD